MPILLRITFMISKESNTPCLNFWMISLIFILICLMISPVLASAQDPIIGVWNDVHRKEDFYSFNPDGTVCETSTSGYMAGKIGCAFKWKNLENGEYALIYAADGIVQEYYHVNGEEIFLDYQCSNPPCYGVGPGSTTPFNELWYTKTTMQLFSSSDITANQNNNLNQPQGNENNPAQSVGQPQTDPIIGTWNIDINAQANSDYGQINDPNVPKTITFNSDGTGAYDSSSGIHHTFTWKQGNSAKWPAASYMITDDTGSSGPIQISSNPAKLLINLWSTGNMDWGVLYTKNSEPSNIQTSQQANQAGSSQNGQSSSSSIISGIVSFLGNILKSIGITGQTSSSSGTSTPANANTQGGSTSPNTAGSSQNSGMPVQQPQPPWGLGEFYGLASNPAAGIDEIKIDFNGRSDWSTSTNQYVYNSPPDLSGMKIVFSTPSTSPITLTQGSTDFYNHVYNQNCSYR